MERRTEYITADCPEYTAAGLDLIQAELTIVALTEELERMRDRLRLAGDAFLAQRQEIERLKARNRQKPCLAEEPPIIRKRGAVEIAYEMQTILAVSKTGCGYKKYARKLCTELIDALERGQ